MTDLPSVLQAALQQGGHDTPRRTAVDERTGRVSRGDLRVIRPSEGVGGDARVGLVLFVDSAREFTEVMLIHTAPELACEVDAILDPSTSSTSHPVVVETDLRGVVWSWQLGSRAGQVSDDTFDALHAIAARGTSDRPRREPALRAGTALAGPSDPRWSFKRSEGEALRLLASDCTDALLDAGSPWVIHRDLLRPELLDFAANPTAVLQDLVHWVATRRVEMTDSDAGYLLELGVLEVEAWTNVGDIGPDVLMSLQTLVERAATSEEISDLNASSSRLVTAKHLESATQDAEPDAVHYLGEREQVAA